MKNLKIRVSKNRRTVRLSWEVGDYWKEIVIPIDEYYESKSK